jgi:DNA polymerase elongation subunit (family B)
MYQNVYLQKGKDLVHLWDDKLGYQTFPYKTFNYAYAPAERGQSTALDGTKVTKIYEFQKDDPAYYETDVPETTRILVDLYSESDLPSEGHVVLTFDIEVEMESGLPDVEKADNEITAIALHDGPTDTYYALVLDKGGKLQNTIKKDNRIIKAFRSERELLNAFLTVYEHINPTILTGWNIDAFDVPYLFNRLVNVLGKQNAYRLSPIRDGFYSPYRKKWSLAGVSILDYITLYKKFTYSLMPSYALNYIAKKELDRTKVEYVGSLDDLFKEDLEKFIEYNIVDVELVVEFERKLQYIDLCRGICHAGHVPYEDYMFSSKYLEGACLNYLKKRNLVAPNKPADRREQMEALKESGEQGFIGAYVKDPIPGKYDWLYDLDLTSLYPSIIMSLNISPETKVGKIANFDAEAFVKGDYRVWNIEHTALNYTTEELRKELNEEKLSISSNGVLYTQDKPGLIADILDEWFSQRVEFRKLEKKFGKEGNKQQHEFYAKRQLVQKILLNSLYGVLGLPAFRFYDVDNAAAVTTTGQTVIKNTAKMVNIKYNKELGTNEDYNIYIDTDSVFFSALPLVKHRFPNWAEFDDAVMTEKIDDIAGEVQDFLNKFYDMMADKFFNIKKHRFEIKKEYISKAGIWIAKKRYAQWIVAANGLPMDKLDVKGLDVVRSSFPKAFQDFMARMLRDILQGKSNESVDNELRDFKLSLAGLDVALIAKGGAVKEISRYDKRGKNKQLGDFEKGTPAHIKAGITYNRLLKHFNCPFKFEPMKDGDKIKWVYLKQNPLSLETTAFKGYQDPPEILEFIQKYIDVDKIFEAELENKMDDFYKALGWEKSSFSSKKLEEFFSF